MHQRKVIRHAIRDALLGQTAAGLRVKATRVLSLRRSELPAIAVYTPEEAVDSDSVATAPRELTRQMPVVIEGWVSVAGEDADDAMDDLAEQIEAAMHADPYFGETVADSILDDTIMEVVQEGDRLMGFVALTYAVSYRTEAPEAPVGLDDFRTVHATHDVGGEPAEDQFTVQEAP